MATIDPLHEELIALADSFAVQVRSDEADKAAGALQTVAAELARLAATPGEDTPRLSRIARLPDGPLLRVDDLSARTDTRRRAADAIRGAVDSVGGGAEVAVHSVDGLRDLDRCRRAAVLRLFPAPQGAKGRLDPSWIDVAADWVFGDQRPEAPVRMRILGVERSVPAAEAAGILHGCAASGVWCDVVTGDLDSRIRTASISFGVAPHLAIAGGGPRCDDDGLLARYDLLREVAESLADRCTYACLDFEETFADLGTGLSHTEWGLDAGASPNVVAGRLCDRYVPEVFPLQVLGPAHHRALLAYDPHRSWGTPIGVDRHLLVLGEPIDWLPHSEVRGDVRGDGWALFEPLLLGEDDLDEALAQTSLAPEDRRSPTSALATGLPDLASIVIDPTRHPRRGTHLTVLELAAWLSGEAHTDDPQTVSPVLRTFVRNLALGLGDDLRQELKPVAGALVGTGPSNDGDERRRAWLLADWLVRGHAPPWLERAGLSESADRLDGLGSITDQPTLVRAVDLLGRAIVTAGRRLEITLEIAGDERAEFVDELAWDVWEQAAERSGWIAASEAMQYEIPDDLAYATDQRVVECSRDPRIRAEVERSPGGLGDAIWSAALHEVASTAWRSAWEVIEEFVHHESTFSVQTTLRRSLETDLGAGGVDSDLLIDEVDRAAHDALARLVLDGTPKAQRWAGVLATISAIEGGERWRGAIDETRSVLGEGLFDEAVWHGRQELDAWIDRAPRLVGRTVAAAVAREASGVAGRAIAARAVAESLAHGASDDEAAAAARVAVAPVVERLALDAFRILDALVILDDPGL